MYISCIIITFIEFYFNWLSQWQFSVFPWIFLQIVDNSFLLNLFRLLDLLCTPVKTVNQNMTEAEMEKVTND